MKKSENQNSSDKIHRGRRRFLQGALLTAATVALSSASVITDAHAVTGGSAQRRLFSPKGLAFSDDGNLYIADGGNYCVQVFDSSQKFINKIGSPGTGKGELNFPTDVVVKDNNIFVLDTNNGRVCVFHRKSGEFITDFGSLGGSSGNLFAPTGLTIYENDLYVANTRGHCVQIWNLENRKPFKVIGIFGDEKSLLSKGSRNIKLRLPCAVAVHREGRGIFIADSGHNRIINTTLDGKYLGEYDAGETGVKLSGPEDLCIFNDELFIVDFGNKRIVRIDLESKKTRVLEGNWHMPRGIDIHDKLLAISDGNEQMDKLNKFTVTIPG